MPDHYMDDIFIDINRKKQLEDAQKNKEFDDAVAGGTLEDLRKGVDIKKKQQLLGTQLLDNIEYGVTGSVNWLKKQAEEDPDRYTDDMLRLLGGGIKNVGWALSKLPLIDEIAQGEDWLAEQARGMSAKLTPQLDPRFAGWGTRVATGLIADKGIGKAYKVSKPLLKKSLLANINRTARPVFAMSDEIPQRQRMIFGSGGIRDGHYDHYKFKDEGWMSDSLARETLEAYQTEGMQFVPDFFKRERDRLLPGFIDEYGDYLVNSGLVSRADLQRMKLGHNVELHHITPLKAGAPLYHNTDFGDAAWKAVTDVFHEHGLFPGMGRPSAIPEFAKTNYMMTLGEPHNLLHNKFLAEFVGKTGSKFFTPARMELIESGLEGRKLVAQEYAVIIKQGQAILEDGMKQMEALFSRSGVSPEQLAELMHRASSKGELKILDTDLLLESVNNQLKNIAEEASWEDFGTALGDEIPEVLQRHLDKGIQSFFQRVQKQYNLGGKGGLGKPPVNPYE